MNRRLLAFLVVIAGAVMGLGFYYVSIASQDPMVDHGPVMCPAYPEAQRIAMANQDQMFTEASRRTTEVVSQSYSGEMLGAVTPSNFIDDYIFRAARDNNVPLGARSSDAEFVRRLFLDLTGRPATPEKALAFINDSNPNKRSALIAELLASDDFKDRLTWFYGELLRMTNAALGMNPNAQNPNGYIKNRKAYYLYLKDAVATNKRWDVVMRDLVAATGNSFDSGPVNYFVRARRGYGDTRDALDEMAITTARVFLGTTLECISCHSGARHLEEINLWLAQRQRSEFWGMAAFFSAIKVDNTRMPSGNPRTETASVVQDDGPGFYNRSGGGGARPARCGTPCTDNKVYPQYIFNGRQLGEEEDYRQVLADLIQDDPQFARALVNNLWKLFLGVGIVEPTSGFDLARQDPSNPPPAPWTIQPTNPELLNRLAQEFTDSGFDVANMASLILNSSTYQFSTYWTNPRSWQDGWAKYFVRHLSRRLEPEQVVDSIMQATNQPFDFEIPGLAEGDNSLHWVNQFPDTSEPVARSRGDYPAPQGIGNILSGGRFDRGNRNNANRPNPPVGSIMQVVTLMNENSFVLPRLRTNRAGSRAQELYQSDKTSRQIVDELYLATLNRLPTDDERSKAIPLIDEDRRKGIEDLSWVLINKPNFLFN